MQWAWYRKWHFIADSQSTTRAPFFLESISISYCYCFPFECVQFIPFMFQESFLLVYWIRVDFFPANKGPPVAELFDIWKHFVNQPSMPVINVRSVNIFWITAVKSVAFCKCCLRFLALPINPNICFSIQSCMQMSSLKYATRTKETDIQLSISSYVLLKTAVKGASLKGRTQGSVANEKNSLYSSNCAPNVKIEIISKCKSQAASH